MSQTLTPAETAADEDGTTARIGALFTIDGPSGVGKSTVAGALAELLSEEEAVLCTAEPSGSEIGKLARGGTYKFHGLALSLLVAADRYYHSEAVISPAVASGKIVVCDRYMPSALVLDRVDGVDLAYIFDVYRHLPQPDIAFFLTGNPEQNRTRAAARGGNSRFHRTTPEAAEAEAAMFTQVATDLTERGYPVTIVKVDGRDARQVAVRMAKMIDAYRTTTAPVKKGW